MQQMTDDTSQSVVSATVPQAFKEEVRVAAARQDMSMADLLREALADFLDGDIEVDDETIEALLDDGQTTPTTDA